MVPGASLTKQHAKTSEMRRSVAMGEIISRRRCRSAARNCHAGGLPSSNFRPRQDPPSSQARAAAKRLNVRRDLP